MLMKPERSEWKKSNLQLIHKISKPFHSVQTEFITSMLSLYQSETDIHKYKFYTEFFHIWFLKIKSITDFLLNSLRHKSPANVSICICFSMWTANREGLSPTTNVQPFKISSANSWTGMMYASIKCCLVDKWAVFDTQFHLSSLYVIMWLFSTARWRTRSSTIKSSPQTACTTHFAHCLHLQTLCK